MRILAGNVRDYDGRKHRSIALARSFVADIEASEEVNWHVDPLIRLGNLTYDARQLVRRWLEDQKAPHLLILGGYGSGKTHLCRRLAYEYYRAWLEANYAGIFPILCPLAPARDYLTLGRYLRYFFKHLGLLPPGQQEQAQILSGHHWLIILDGLDEVRPGPSTQAIRRLFEELRDLPIRGCRLLVTARSHMFLRDDQVWGVGSFGKWYEVSKNLGVRDFYLVGELEPFGESQRMAYVVKRAGPRAAAIIKWIASMYRLEELATKPLFLRMIVDSYEELRRRDSRVVNLWELYRIYVTRTLSKRRHRTGKSVENLFELSRRIAVKMFQRQRFLIHSHEFTRLAQSLQVEDSRLSIDRVGGGQADLLLQRHENKIAFSHPSIYEFFLADTVMRELERRNTQLISSGLLSAETLAFMTNAQRIGRFRVDWTWLTRSLRQVEGDRFRWMITNVLRLCALICPSLLQRLLPSALQSPDVYVVRVALKLTGYQRFHKSKGLILDLLKSSDTEVRYLAIEASGLHQLSGAAEAIADGVHSSDSTLRRISLWAMRKIRSYDLVPLAISLLEESDPNAIRAAADILGMRQDCRGLGALEAALTRVDPNSWSAYYINEAIAAITSRERVNWKRELKTLLANPSACERLLRERSELWRKRYLLEVIGEGRLVRYSNILKRIYSGEQPQVKNSIIDALGEMRLPENIDFLIRNFETETVPELKANILWALGNTGDIRSLGTVVQGLADNEPLVREWAQWARAQFGRAVLPGTWEPMYIYPQVPSSAV